jgi:hypothetical protein
VCDPVFSCTSHCHCHLPRAPSPEWYRVTTSRIARGLGPYVPRLFKSPPAASQSSFHGSAVSTGGVLPPMPSLPPLFSLDDIATRRRCPPPTRTCARTSATPTPPQVVAKHPPPLPWPLLPPTFGAHIRQPLPPLLPSFPLSYVLPPSSAGRCRAARYRAPLFPMRITHCHTPFPCPFLLVVLPAPRERRRHNTRTQNTPQSTTRV